MPGRKPGMIFFSPRDGDHAANFRHRKASSQNVSVTTVTPEDASTS